LRAVVQRVSRARVLVSGEEVGAIDVGLVVLLGVAGGDKGADAVAIADKVVGLRVFSDQSERMNLSVAEVGGSILLISQFTLLGDVRRGRRPSFTGAAPPAEAAALLDVVEARLAESGVPVAMGRFGAHMEVDLCNDGPVTIVIDTAGGRVA